MWILPNYLRDISIVESVKTVNIICLGVLYGIAFTIYDRITQNHQDIAVVMRGGQPESDTYALISELSEQKSDRALHLLSRENIDTAQINLWKESSVTIKTHQLRTLSSFRAIANSQIVLCKSNVHMRWRRLFDSSDRKYIRLFHGPITKATGKVKQSSVSSETNEKLNPVIPYRSVGSDVERYFRASAEGRNPKLFPKWGYPRFDRIEQLKKGESQPVLPERSREILEDRRYTDILYAPTHKHDLYTTAFFPFEEMCKQQLQNWLSKHNVRIFLRPHPREETGYERLVDNETIYSADQNFATSATELLPYMDGLITDYSSIYIEYLPFNRPIIFVKDNHSRFINEHGIAFEYNKYFPGAKPDSFQEFLLELERTVDRKEEDEYADQRQFVRNTFIDLESQSFLESVL